MTEIRFLRPDDDLCAVSRIYEESWKYAYKGIIPQDYLDSIPEGRWAGRITREGMHTLLLTENGQLAGTASFCKSRWEQHSGFGEIVSIYFLPAYIGRGYGRQLFQRCTEELHAMGFSRLLLWVLEENARARAFYEKNGFRCAGEYQEIQLSGKTLREVLYTNAPPSL